MIGRFKFWLECARWYSLPMSVFSWSIVYLYALNNGGNSLYGVIALIGICFAHLGTNLLDDFCDYHHLHKCLGDDNKLTLPNTQRGKCKYILEKKVKLTEVISVAGLFCLIALLTGIFFIFAVSPKVSIFMLIGAFIVLTYSFLSNIRLSEFAVATAFGPLLFGGVYLVMTGKLVPEVFILSIPSTVFTVNLLFTDTFLDKDIDKVEGKKTLVGFLKDDEAIFRFQKRLLVFGYLSVFLIPIFDIADWQVFFVFLTIPLAVDLLDSLKEYSKNPISVPEKKWYHFPFERWEDIKENRSPSFMFRMYQARNLMIYSSVILALCLQVS